MAPANMPEHYGRQQALDEPECPESAFCRPKPGLIIKLSDNQASIHISSLWMSQMSSVRLMAGMMR